MLWPIRKFKKIKNRFSVNSQNLRYTIFCESTVYIHVYHNFHSLKILSFLVPQPYVQISKSANILPPNKLSLTVVDDLHVHVEPGKMDFLVDVTFTE